MKRLNTRLALFLLSIGLFVAGCQAESNKATKNSTEMQNNSLKLAEFKDQGYVFDTYTTPKGREVNLIFIKHGSIAIDIDGYLVYIDPVTLYGNDFSKLPKADLLMVTHEHHDHFDKAAIDELTSGDTRLIGSRRINEMDKRFSKLLPGESVTIDGNDITVTAVPAYNITPDHLQFHPKERQDDGFLFDIDGLRIYVAGDTENIPEMADLKDIDIAFLPVNQPYTMTPEQAVEAVSMFEPKILYPYHYGNTDLTPLVEALKGGQTEVKVRELQ